MAAYVEEPMMVMSPQSIPVRLPHFSLRGESVLFMVSSREILRLDEDEKALFLAIDGHRTVEELERIASGARFKLIEWKTKQIVVDIPARSKRPLHRRHIVVVEPHMDDACLSMGGYILRNSPDARVTILSVTRWSNSTTYLSRRLTDFVDVSEVSALRLAESMIACRILGAELQVMDESDAPIYLEQVGIDLAELDKDSLLAAFLILDAYNSFRPQPAEIDDLAAKLRTTLSALAPTEIWIPLAIGDHVDHVRTRDASLTVLRDGPHALKQSLWGFYEDVPYTTLYPSESAAIVGVLSEHGADLEPVLHDCGSTFEMKNTAVASYASQWKAEVIGVRVRDAAKLAGGGMLAERGYWIRNPGEAAPPNRTTQVRSRAVDLEEHFCEWLLRWENAPLIAVAASVAFGNLEAGFCMLRDRLPLARFDVYTQGIAAVESDALALPGVAWQRVRETWEEMLVVLRGLARAGVPTLVIARGPTVEADLRDLDFPVGASLATPSLGLLCRHLAWR